MEEKKSYYLYGMHPVTEAVLSGKSIEKVVFKQGLEGPQFRNLMALLKEKDVPCQFVPAERLNKIDKGGRSQGVVAYMAQIDYTPFEEAVENAFRKSDAPVFVMLDGVSDVRNLGAIARTAECAGVSAIILPAKGGAAINAEAIKVSAGALLRIDTCKTQNLRIPIYYLKERGFQVVAATEKTDSLIYEADFKQPTVIVMGSEGKGISDSVMKLCDAKVKIPMHGEIESLNVSVATSIILFEVVRQRL
ncbi:MAG: 23S rRNA (guanosine(2251)-2'-O)-methyltransferase RlmB [Bacteroidales bacterium]|jgi:23S rRNA (guanosine2251-2'-O)-methyltransferase|nr:23S rRNA (guanosine(2251)-2'-O)-methyltransferase RlmB [Bacteroidales bacterium]MBO7284911.1 23S rRNA (guanosine(2251)-2'-O)-methyltransferase RlmB [Bacteroidales bacterium]MBO7323422.1 23S rRNA (guanosine(2251)-2'-O)-methyltransferase RlmB [Bacteroidales bacterium]MBQ1279875.1 23S rRNA (guanosine(2251)-2'-O)-methyltransferase RlmB [Bacteroidales bacterium]MBQ5881954.1 23S rRNA (guanosine(2251)-2'-O)-methyltransferase RlmB [Bacteroidales bacterium]